MKEYLGDCLNVLDFSLKPEVRVITVSLLITPSDLSLELNCEELMFMTKL